MTQEYKIAMNENIKPNRGLVFTYKGTVEYDKLIDSAELKAVVEAIRNGDEKKKEELPFRCPHFTEFVNCHRAQKDAIPITFTWHTVVDCDVKEEVEPAIKKAKEVNENKESKFYHKVTYIQMSAREKVHFDIIMPVGMTIEEAQEAFAKEIGITFDRSCITPERMIYITLKTDERFRSADFLRVLSAEERKEREDALKARGLTPFSLKEKAKAKSVTRDSVTVVFSDSKDSNSKDSYPTEYHGIKYSDILQRYIQMFDDGFEPTEGDRNNKVYEFAKVLRHICGFDQGFLESIIPNYGLPVDEWRKAIASALNQERKGTPYRLTQVINSLKAETKKQLPSINQQNNQQPPEYQGKVSKFHRLVASKVPAFYKPIVYDAVAAPCASHIHGVKFRYIDNTLQEPAFFEIQIAEQSSGKSGIDPIIEAVTAPIKARDVENRKRDTEWKQKNRKEKNKCPRPTDICIQILSTDITRAALIQRIIDCNNNGERSVYSYVSEIELLNKIAKSSSDVSEIIRLLYDHSTLGAERVGTESVDGSAPLRWQINASTTAGNALKWFGKTALTDGTLTRPNLLTFFQDEDEIPVYGNYDEKFTEDLQPYLDNLNNASGIIECPRANAIARELLAECKQTALQMESKAYKIYSYRAVRSAWQRAMVFYIAEGYKWSPALTYYMQWSVRRDLWTKMYYFGDLIEQKMQEENAIGNNGPRNMLESLPDEFSEEEYVNLRKALGKNGDGKATLRKWVQRQYIVRDDITEHYIKTKNDKGGRNG